MTAGAPKTPAEVQIVDKARRGPKVRSLKCRTYMLFGRWNQATPLLNCSYVRQRSREIRGASSSAPLYHVFSPYKLLCGTLFHDFCVF